MEVTFCKGIFSRSWHSGPSRRRGVVENILEKQEMSILQHLCKFKYKQRLVPPMQERRPISAACSYCLPMSSRQLDEEVKAMGIQNLLYVPTLNQDAPWFSRHFPILSYFWTQGALSSDQTKLVYNQDILEDESLFHYPSKRTGTHSAEDVEKWTQEVESASKRMTMDNSLDSSCVRRSIWIVKPFLRLYLAASQMIREWILKTPMRIIGYITAKGLQRIFNAVCVHEGELDLLLRAHASALPIIYVPIHKSFMDSMILRWTLIHAGLPVPYSVVSSRESRFLRLVGGIPRPDIPITIDPIDGKMVLTATITSFVKALLKKGGSLQLVMEGNKSRVGKPSTELYGTELLKVVYDLYEAREIEDAYIVPVSFSYEILPEDSIQWFSFSQKKVKYGILSYLWKFLSLSKQQLGSSRISFGQPFGLREFFSSMQENKKFNCVASGDDTVEAYHKTYESSELNWLSPVGSTASIPSLCGELDLIDFTACELTTALPKINLLAFHSIYSAANATVIMGTHAVAFLLLKKFRSGTTLSTLVQEFEELFKCMDKRKRECGFAGDMKAVVLNSLRILGPESVSLQSDVDDFHSVIVAPILSPNNLLRLGYYANHILPIFAMEAIVAVAVWALAGNQLSVSRGFDFDIRVKDEDLIHHCMIIYGTLATEFFLHEPCKLGLSAIRKTFESLNDDCLLQFLMDETVRRNRRFYDADDEIDEDYFPGTTALNGPQVDDVTGDYFFTPYEYKIISSEENVDRLLFLKSLLVPTLEIYSFIGKELSKIPTDSNGLKRIDKRQFQKYILSKLTENFASDDYGEFLSMDYVKSSLFAFESNGIFYISSDRMNSVRYIDMTDDTDSSEKLGQSLNNLLRVITQ